MKVFEPGESVKFTGLFDKDGALLGALYEGRRAASNETTRHVTGVVVKEMYEGGLYCLSAMGCNLLVEGSMMETCKADEKKSQD